MAAEPNVYGPFFIQNGVTNVAAQVALVGMSACGIQVVGTISAEYVTVQGTIDGTNYAVLPITDSAGDEVASGQITAAGIYYTYFAALSSLKVIPYGSFSGSVQVTLLPNPVGTGGIVLSAS